MIKKSTVGELVYKLTDIECTSEMFFEILHLGLYIGP